MLNRMETMVLMGMELPMAAIRSQIAAGVDILVHLGKLRDKSRRILSIVEIDKIEQGEIQLNPLYEFVEMGVQNGKIIGNWIKKGEILHREKFYRAGIKES